MSKLAYMMAGPYLNALARSVQTPSVGVLLAGYQASWAYDGDTIRPIAFARQTGLNFFGQGLNQIRNGDAELAFVGGVPALGWTKTGLGATITRETSGPYKGAAYIKIAGVSAQLMYDQQVAAGEILNLTIAAKKGSGGGNAYCQNLSTGNWLEQKTLESGVWSPTPVAFHSASDDWNNLIGQFRVESFLQCGQDPVLRWTLESTTGNVFFDNFLVWPRIDTVVIAGHNIPPGILFQVFSGNVDVGATSLRHTFAGATHARHVMYAALAAPVDDPMWSLAFPISRVDSNPIYIGEIIMGQRAQLERRFDPGIKVATMFAQDRSESELQSFKRAVHPQRKVTVNFKDFEASSFDQRQELMERSKNGADPVVFIHDSEDPGSGLVGRISPSQDYTHIEADAANKSTPFEILELPLPNLYSNDI